MLLVLSPLFARGQVVGEYPLKAVFLFHFAQFVDWPKESFAETNSPIVIGVLGRDPFGALLDEAVVNETVKGRKLVVARYDRVQEVRNCHLLFISSSEDWHLERILAELTAKALLSVSESPGFARRGGMIEFIKVQRRIRFMINVEAAQTARLQISSKLLRWAEIVDSKND
jgi:hypothetical protein